MEISLVLWLFNHWVHVEEYLNTATGSLSKFQEATLKITSTKALQISHRGPTSRGIIVSHKGMW